MWKCGECIDYLIINFHIAHIPTFSTFKKLFGFGNQALALRYGIFNVTD